MHGTYFLLKHLMEAGRNDVVYTFATKTDYPSWGHMLEEGATTMWESWSGASRIHDTLISIGAWFIQGLGGIGLDENAPGFRHFFVKPAMVGDLTHARASYNSLRGRITSSWRKEKRALHLDVTVPPGTTATVSIPTASAEAVTEGGRPVSRSPFVKYSGMEEGRAVYRVQSGRYRFVSKNGF